MKLNRRSSLRAMAAMPFLGRLFRPEARAAGPELEPELPTITATEALRDWYLGHVHRGLEGRSFCLGVEMILWPEWHKHCLELDLPVVTEFEDGLTADFVATLCAIEVRPDRIMTPRWSVDIDGLHAADEFARDVVKGLDAIVRELVEDKQAWAPPSWPSRTSSSSAAARRTWSSTSST